MRSFVDELNGRGNVANLEALVRQAPARAWLRHSTIQERLGHSMLRRRVICSYVLNRGGRVSEVRQIFLSLLQRRFYPEPDLSCRPCRDRTCARSDGTRDITLNGPELAAQALRAGVVDELQMIVFPLVLGAGKQFSPDRVRLKLELLDEHRFRNGVIVLRYNCSLLLGRRLDISVTTPSLTLMKATRGGSVFYNERGEA